jgi:hypothetical protein
MDQVVCAARTEEPRAEAQRAQSTAKLDMKPTLDDILPKPERFRWIWERDRPGRPGRRLAGQSYDDSANTIRCGAEERKGFRRDAENGGRDDRAPQSNCIVPAKKGLSSFLLCALCASARFIASRFGAGWLFIFLIAGTILPQIRKNRKPTVGF